VVAILAGLFFVVAVVLMASAPWVLVRPDQVTRTELDRGVPHHCRQCGRDHPGTGTAPGAVDRRTPIASMETGLVRRRRGGTRSPICTGLMCGTGCQPASPFAEQCSALAVWIPWADLYQQCCPQMGVKGRGRPEGLHFCTVGLRPAGPPTRPKGKERGGAPEVLFRALPAPKLWNLLGGLI
jgi:hypothetical protein